MLRAVGCFMNTIRMAPPKRTSIGSPSRHTIPASPLIILQICLAEVAVLCSVCPPAFFIFTLCLMTTMQQLVKIPMFSS